MELDIKRVSKSPAHRASEERNHPDLPYDFYHALCRIYRKFIIAHGRFI